MRNRSALAGALAVSAALVLSGCSAPDSPTRPFYSDQTFDSVEFGVAHLEDGRYVVCAVTSPWDESGISCDWEGATTDPVVSSDAAELVSTIVEAPNGKRIPCIATSQWDKAGLDCEWGTDL